MPAATLDMEMVVEQRAGATRRVNDRRSFPPQGKPPGEERRLEGRRKIERRRQIDPTTCERDYSLDEVEFMSAMDTYKRRSGRAFPTWSEVLEVVRSLGYRKVEAPSEIIMKSS
ncbi:MAG: hypothetical protein NT013_15965 [Planctomycetia bacterium]|nr:hypothetical protein [Planctomycetia bacterium]